MINLQKSILNTLKYHDFFDYPLTLKEVWRFLIFSNSKLKVKSFKQQPKFKNFQLVLTKLQKEKSIFYKKPYYYLPGRENIVKLRNQRASYSREKIKIAKGIIKIFQYIPFIKAIAITGALAMDNTIREDDIDMMVITSRNRLWLTRVLVLIILQLLGKRRKPGQKDVKDRICVNLLLDELVLSLLKKKRNLWTAHEIVQAKPIFNKSYTWEKFLTANMWIKDYLPNSLEQPAIHMNFKKDKVSILHTLYSLPFDLLNNLAFQLQFIFMKSKITNEDISLHHAFFHPIKRDGESLGKFNS